MFKAIRSAMREAAVFIISIIVLILKPEFSHGGDPRPPWTKWMEWEAYGHLENRLLETIQSHILKVEEIIEGTNDMRFMYEESPQFEMGYVIGEIIERYRKTVEIAKFYSRFNYGHDDIVLKFVFRLELVQKLYFEAYHLVQMLNEIPRKYAHMPEFGDILSNVDHEQVMRHYRMEDRQRKRKEKARKKMEKMYKKLSETYAKSKKDEYTDRKSPENKRWPLDYGWEIDPNWPELIW